MDLTPRLMAVANMVEKGSIIADIGTDHGYVPVYLVKKGVCPGAIACDINAGPLGNAQGYIRATGLDNLIQTRLGGGLSPIKPGEVSGIVIAGMGGVLMTEILTQGRDVLERADYCILQPMVAQDILRKWIYDNGYTIIAEDLAREDNRIYEIIKIKKGQDVVSDDIYYRAGKKLIEKKHPLLKELIDKRLAEQKTILNSLEGATSEAALSRYNETKVLIAKYQEVLTWL